MSLVDLMAVINPATEERIGWVRPADPAAIAAAIGTARQAFDSGPWPRMSHLERAEKLTALARLYVARAEQMGQLITSQNGSPAVFTAQVTHPAAIATYYGGLAPHYPWEVADEGGVSIRREPVGVVAAIVPWNMPQKTIMMKVAPALLAGCTVIVKPAPQTPLDALLLAEWAAEVGIPPGVLTVVPAWSRDAQALVEHPWVDKVAFTGSTAVGTYLAAIAGGRCARISLELGGKSAAIALPDADPDMVAAALAHDTFALSGQICSAHTRLLVPAEHQHWYAEAVASVADSLQLGDPTDPDTRIGPLITRVAQRRVLNFIQDAVEGGSAKLVTGSTKAPDRPGWYVTPTVLSQVDPSARIAQEETFGPVLSVIPYREVAQAVAIANGTRYGLEAAIWTADLEAAAAMAPLLQAGTVRINGADPPIWAPLGGYKQSGLGRELGMEGLAGYLETKAIIRQPAAGLW